ncbi:hypothetical protein MACK_003355 [Theileria orientalis]|uniref:Translation initiation factor 3 N-terminal domain-containing protein n=1 Tax=Theileria orientalis TaxID=68886 RepID=A0A976SIK0_THEOR|nr:hypothetical protein MACK_003355 [Theileria orientalis]
MYIYIFKNLFKHSRWSYAPTYRFSSVRNADAPGPVKKFLKDEEILVEKVRVLKDKKLLGDYTTHEARLIAKNDNMNLILFKPNSDPPICVIDNYKQFLKTLSGKDPKKDDSTYSFDPSLKSKTVQISENCGASDLDRKLNSIRNFLLSGHRVDVLVFTKGKRIRELNRKYDTASKSSSSQDAVKEAAEIAEARGLKVTHDLTNSILQKIDYIYSRLVDISRPHTLRNKVNVNSRQIMLKFWPK